MQGNRFMTSLAVFQYNVTCNFIFLLLITLKEGCSQLGSGLLRMFYFCIYAFFCPFCDLFGTDHRFPLPLRELRPGMRCVASTEAIHIVLSDACSNARPFYASFCIADVPCYPFSTKETGHWAYRIQNAARFAVNHFAMSLISASLRDTVSRLIFCFEALIADEPMAIPQNSASATCRFKNVFIFDVGRCARSATLE
jgi:hypothetical protein